jgi:primosomal protein N' (replication factor Y)
LANILISGLNEAATLAEVERATAYAAGVISGNRMPVVIVGPAPSPIDRIRGRWRWHFLLKSGSAKALGMVCKHLQYRYDFKPGPTELRLVIDRDPVSLL